MTQPIIHIPVQSLLDCIPGADASRLRTIQISPLSGGHVASGVFRLDLQLADQIEPMSFVQKLTHGREVQVMKLLTRDFDLPELPKLIDSNVHTVNPAQNGASWFITAYYEGTTLSFDDDLPESVIRALASIHAFYAASPEQLNGFPRADTDYLDGLLEYVLMALADQREKLPTSVYEAVHEQLMTAKNTSILAQVVQRLPLTLAHGDVHSGNIIRLKSGQHILFDWGNARVAPAMLDIANMIQLDSAEWDIYISAWNESAGQPLDMNMARLGYTWATALVNLQYLPFAMAHLEPASVTDMTHKLQTALSTLQASISVS